MGVVAEEQRRWSVSLRHPASEARGMRPDPAQTCLALQVIGRSKLHDQRHVRAFRGAPSSPSMPSAIPREVGRGVFEVARQSADFEDGRFAVGAHDRHNRLDWLLATSRIELLPVLLRQDAYPDSFAERCMNQAGGECLLVDLRGGADNPLLDSG